MSKSAKKTKPVEIKSNKVLISKKLIYSLSIVLLFLVVFAALTYLFLLNRYYPGIFIGNVNLAGLTPDQAAAQINSSTNQRTKIPLKFSFQGQQFTIDISTLQLQIDSDTTLAQAFQYGHEKFYYQPVHLNLSPRFNCLNCFATIKQAINQYPLEAQIKVDGQDITVIPSQDGLVLDEDALKNRLAEYLNSGHLPSAILPTKKTYPRLSYAAALEIKKIIDHTKTNPIVLTFNSHSWTIDANTLINLLDLQNSQSNLATTSFDNTQVQIQSITLGSKTYNNPQLVLDQVKLDKYFAKIAADIDQPVAEPLFQFDGKKVTQFQPPTQGQKLDVAASKASLITALAKGDNQPISLTVDITQPKNKLTNDLGIRELIAEGVSNFAHSIPNRIYNIGLAASRINGILIPPGETFSFVNTVGDISAASGYKQGYIIKEGRTVLDDGGGVCQVSTTLFRAALYAGVPITDRTAHAYRVEYYEQGFPPGLDATIFSPSVDLKFKNDTPANILIQTRIEGLTLYVDFYGTKDGRISTISKPVVLSQTPPLPEIRQDDPTLPRGTIKQVDFPAWGANVIFNRTVTRGGKTLIHETYRSNYRPWQAIYLVGTKES